MTKQEFLEKLAALLQDIPAVAVESDNNRLQFSILVYVSYVSL